MRKIQTRLPWMGKLLAAELRLCKRMSEMLQAVYPDASEPLRLAARCQHIRRWELGPRPLIRPDAPVICNGGPKKNAAMRTAAADMLRGAGYEDE